MQRASLLRPAARCDAQALRPLPLLPPVRTLPLPQLPPQAAAWLLPLLPLPPMMPQRPRLPLPLAVAVHLAQLAEPLRRRRLLQAA